ncbi:hypothetical protein JCM15519_34470 [Fundidesulfovibrio butyratiphilus]
MTQTTRLVTTCTRDCPNTCGLVATVTDGLLTDLTGDPNHPFTKGAACRKARKYVERVYHPERVIHPLIRRNGRFERASWDEALDLIAARMRTIKAESGPEAVLYYQGYGERTALKLLNRYFFNLFGAVTTLRGSLCGGTGQASQNLDLGERISHDPLDHENSASVILWARNPVSTNVSLVPILSRIKKRGGRVILVDPAPSRTAVLATHHIAPRPGRDACLALAAAKLIVEAGAHDRDFLEHHTEGAQRYLRLLASFSLDRLCSLAGVGPDQARLLADTLMTQKPTAQLLGWGLHRHASAHLGIRAIDALGAISGNIGVPGGGVSQGFEEYGPYDQRFWGDERNPGRRTLLMPTIGQEILDAKDPAIRMIFVTAANPACMAPNSAKVVQAFRRTEFVVYSGHFLDDTAELAHVFLPATTFLEERDAMASYGHNYLGPVNRAIAPVGECKSEFQMFSELSERFPFARFFRRDEDAWLFDLLAPARAQGLDMADLRSRAFRLNAPMAPYADRIFPTPSGKFRLLTELNPADLPTTDPRYPYKLLTIAPHDHICSERTMAEHSPLPEVRLGVAEAARAGLTDGQTVRLESPVGSARAKLRTLAGQRPDILVAERGGWFKAGHGLNRLTRDMASAVGDGTPYYETAVAVRACRETGLEGARVLMALLDGDASGGTFQKALERLGAEMTVVRPDAGAALPASPEGYAALAVFGGPCGTFDRTHPAFSALADLILAFDRQGKPVAAMGPGALALAEAHGATTRPRRGPVFGFTRTAPSEAMAHDPVLSGLEIPALMAVEPAGLDPSDRITPLLVDHDGAVLGFRAGRAGYGFPLHLEADATLASTWAKRFRSTLPDGRSKAADGFDDAFFSQLRADLPLLAAASDAFCRRVADRWLGLTIETNTSRK